MIRVVLILAYDGSNYYGWQVQKISNLPTVQQQLELALSKVANQPIHTTVAGRTDAKVHASYQVVHFDCQINRPITAWIFGVNSYLPPSIRVLDAKEIGINFDARRSARSRTYNYWIYNAPISPSLFRNYLGWEYKKLNVEFMQQASNYWLGEHDFSSFRGKDCQSNSVIRTVYDIKCRRINDLINITITANAFLKHMVRNMVGVLIKISQGERKNIPIAKEILLAKDRTCAANTAIPQGLYLTNINYPKVFNITTSLKGERSNILKFFM